MPKYICEISASSWFYYIEIIYDARSHASKIPLLPRFSEVHLPSSEHFSRVVLAYVV